MAYTQLSPTGIPGRRYSFLAKTESAAEKGIGLFTELSLIGLPGRIHSFSAKTAAVASEKGIGLFTELSLIGLPGRIHSFVAKTAAEVSDVIPEVEVSGGGGGGAVYYDRALNIRLKRDDEEILEFITNIVTQGILN